MTFNNKTYNALKFVALILLPALIALYLGVSGLWGLGYTEQVAGTLTLLDTFLGAILQISSAKFNADVDGVLHTDGGTDELSGHPNLGLTLTKDPAELLGKDKVVLKVGNPPLVNQ